MGFYVDDKEIIDAINRFGYGVAIEITSSINRSGKNKQLQNSKRCLEDLLPDSNIDSCLTFVNKKGNSSNCDILCKINSYDQKLLFEAQKTFMDDITIFPHHKEFFEILKQSVDVLNNRLNNTSKTLKLQLEEALLYKKKLTKNYSMSEFMILPQNGVNSVDSLNQADNLLLDEIYFSNPKYFKEFVGIKIEDLQKNRSDKITTAHYFEAYKIFCEGFKNYSLVSKDNLTTRCYKFSKARSELITKFYASLLSDVKSELLEHYVQSVITDNLQNFDYVCSREPIFTKKSGRIVSTPDIVLAVNQEIFYSALENSSLLTFKNFDRPRKIKEAPNPSSQNRVRNNRFCPNY